MKTWKKTACGMCRLFTAAVLSLVLFLAAGSMTVYAAKQPKLNKTTVYLLKGKTTVLKVKNTNKKITWKSSKPSVVTVSKKGKLKARKNGAAVITAKIKDGKTLKCKVYVGKYQWIRGRALASKHKKGKWRFLEFAEKNDEGGSKIIRIYARPDQQILKFYYYSNPMTPDEGGRVELKISSEAAVSASGKAADWNYGNECGADIVLTKTGFDGIDPKEGSPAGIAYSNYSSNKEYEYDEDNDEETWEKEDRANTESQVLYRINIAFRGWNFLMKKYKVSMTDIGFTNWKK